MLVVEVLLEGQLKLNGVFVELLLIGDWEGALLLFELKENKLDGAGGGGKFLLVLSISKYLKSNELREAFISR